MLARQYVLVAMMGGGLFLSGCGSQPEPLYQWEAYQPQVYEYLKGHPGQVDEQIIVLEEGLQKINAGNKTPPPGYHAQLGLLYSLKGDGDRMVQEFQAEKQLYPESVVFMDFLIKNAKK